MSTDETTPQWLAWLVVSLTGIGLGFFYWHISWGYVPHLFPLTFTQAQWMAVPSAGAKGYFRKELYIPDAAELVWNASNTSKALQATTKGQGAHQGTVQQAWIKVAATENFILYLNGRSVAQAENGLRNIGGIYDIGPYLRPGKNVIGVQVNKTIYPAVAKAVVEGAYRDRAGQEHIFFSDASWRASAREESQVNGSVLWHARNFRADSWALVRVLGVPSQADSILPISTPPDLLTSMPRGQWIGNTGPEAAAAVFAHTFVVPQQTQGAWIRMATAYGQYALAINGVAITSQEVVESTLDMYDIGPYLKTGTNTIQAHVTGRSYTSPRLLMDGVVLLAGRASPLFATEATWQSMQPGVGQWRPVVVLGDYAATAQYLQKQVINAPVPVLYASQQTVHLIVCLLVALVATLLIWMAWSFIVFSIRRDITWHDMRTLDGFLHLPSLLLLAIVYLLRYDIRYDMAFPFQSIWIDSALVLLALFRGGCLVEACYRRWKTRTIAESSITSSVPPRSGKFRILCLTCGLIVIAGAGLSLRVSHLNTMSLSHDETAVALTARVILEKGYPFRILGGVERPLTTYELLPFPVALAVMVFGQNDMVTRLPALVFAGVTFALLYYIAMCLWGIEAGILVATVYAFSPFAIRWGTNAFHPQQTQMCALLTAYCWYKAIEKPSPAIQTGYVYGAGVGFIMTYLSWEASGLLLPALFLCLLVTKGRDFSWLKSGHLWLVILSIFLVVTVQQGVRVLANAPYLTVGLGLAGSTIKLSFLDPMYDPLFYVENFLLEKNHIVLALTILVGLPVIFKHQSMRYFLVLFVLIIALLNNLLPQLSVRYVYFAQPFFLLSAAAIVTYIVAHIRNLYHARLSCIVAVAQHLVTAAFLAMIFLSTNALALHLDRLGSKPSGVALMVPEGFDIDYRSTYHFLKHSIAEDDAMIALMPHMAVYYANRRSNHYLQEYTDRQVTYDVGQGSPSYLDKYIGSAVIRNLPELKEVLNRYRKVWLVATPYGALSVDNSDELLQYIAKNTKVVYESFESKVYVWEQ